MGNNFKGRTVFVADGNVEKALRKFKKKIQTSGILNDLRDRECYIKPTTHRKLKRNAARKRWEKQLREQQLPKKLY
jgi:small subunit ribosomal protein S21